MTKTLNLVTHNGRFHCDEVLGYAILRLAHGDADVELNLVRTRDPERISAADIVWDVGGVFDPAQNRFDHHMASPPMRDKGHAYSSAGLLWRTYGHKAVENAVRYVGVDEDVIEEIWSHIDQSLIRLVDMVDNGDAGFDPADPFMSFSLPNLINTMNPMWNDEDIHRLQDEKFTEAVDIAGKFLQAAVDTEYARKLAEKVVLDAYHNGTDPRVLMLPKGMSWQGTAFRNEFDTLFAVYPQDEKWSISCMPPEPRSFDQKVSLPDEWGGLEGQELAAVSGVSDAVFSHKKRFFAVAGSREGALEMVSRALVLAGHPELNSQAPKP